MDHNVHESDSDLSLVHNMNTGSLKNLLEIRRDTGLFNLLDESERESIIQECRDLVKMIRQRGNR